LYCEIGSTEKSQLVSPEHRIKMPPSSNFRNELKSILTYFPHLNSITFGYNGEPTLNENILDFLKIAADVREELKWTGQKPLLTLFTNSSTLHFEEIRERVKQFELILAKLDAGSDEFFKIINSPHERVPSIEIIVESLRKLREEMPKDHKLAIQCLFFKSYRDDFKPNDDPQNVENIARAIKRIKPDLVQVYSIARIPAQYYVFAIDDDRKKEIVKSIKDIICDNSIQVNYY
jgi:wyosine [tRNA(Phe)-imidazoG37] synthetase (radical SAM superfamily)